MVIQRHVLSRGGGGGRFPSLENLRDRKVASPGRQEARPWRVLVGNDGRRSFIGLSAPRQGKENFANLPSFLGAGRLS